MTPLPSQDNAERGGTTVFRNKTRDPEVSASHNMLEEQALMLVRASLEADALSNRRDLRPADMDRMLSVAKGKLRGMSERELRGISVASGSLKTLTDYSLSAAPVTDLRSPAALALAAERENAGGTEGGNSISARLLRADMDRAERAASSARYDGMGGSERLSHGDLQNMAAARAAANEYGMPWALNNPELLKLGAGAIKTLHDAGVQKERFERMTGDKVGFRAATAVDIAAFAKRHNLTPEQTNKLYDKISDGVEIISGGNKTIQRELDEATRKYVTGADTPEARQALQAAYAKHADTPEKKKAAEEVPTALIKAAEQTQAKILKADEAIVKVDADIAKRNAVVASNTSKADEYGAEPVTPKQQAEKPATSTKPPKTVATATAVKATPSGRAAGPV